MKLVAINGSPRKQRNTGTLLEQIVNGAASRGAEADLVHLCSLQYRGCVSCFHCKRVGGKSYGRCVLKDELMPVLQAAHEADVVVLGSPVYFNCETGMMRSFMERFLFQYLLYTTQKPPLSPVGKKTALVYTMNIKEQDIPIYNTNHAINGSKAIMERLFASCEVFLCTDTKQMDDYSKYEVDYFDPAVKDARHAEVFPQDAQRAFEFGVTLVS